MVDKSDSDRQNVISATTRNCRRGEKEEGKGGGEGEEGKMKVQSQRKEENQGR